MTINNLEGLIKGLVGNMVNMSEIAASLKGVSGNAGKSFEARLASNDIQDLEKLKRSLAGGKSHAQNRTYAMAAKGHEYKDYEADIKKVTAKLQELKDIIDNKPSVDEQVTCALEFDMMPKKILDGYVLPSVEATLDAILSQIAAKTNKATVAKLVSQASEERNPMVDNLLTNYDARILNEFDQRLAKNADDPAKRDHRVWTIVKKANFLASLATANK